MIVLLIIYNFNDFFKNVVLWIKGVKSVLFIFIIFRLWNFLIELKFFSFIFVLVYKGIFLSLLLIISIVLN